MKFTSYVLIENATNSVDPLGFLRPSSALADLLFPQFTVLSNHPSYHGFLAFAYQFLEGNGITPSRREFARRFREIEILWGVLNARAGQSIINITKFQRFAEDDGFRLSEAIKAKWLFARLNYGTLGHYSSPSVFWKILEPGGTSLTKSGEDLAVSWKVRSKLDFGVLADKWWRDESVFSSAGYPPCEEAFKLTGIPDESERTVWTELIDGTCSRDFVTAPLWQMPVPKYVLALQESEATYPGYFPAVLEHFAAYPDLCRRIRLCECFERLSGLVQFVFEWEYVRRLEEVKKIGFHQGSVPKAVSSLLSEAARSFLASQSVKDHWQFPNVLAPGGDYATVARLILEHHVSHQRSKGAAAFISGDDIVVKDRVDAGSFKRFFEMMAENPDTLGNATQWRYRRDWHFNRANLWLEYSRGYQ